MDLSIVIPAYNEETNIEPLYRRLKPVLNKITREHEIIFVDDGSRDGTFAKIQNLHARDSRVHGIQFRRNFGKAAALFAGLEASAGKHLVTMDADLQDDPQEIPRLLQPLAHGYDLVVGWKYKRQDPLTKTLPSKVFNFLVRRLTHITLHDSDSNFRAMTREVADDLQFYGGLFRYIPTLAHYKGFKIGEIKVVHHRRFSGTAKFKSFGRLLKGFLDLLTVKFLIDYKNSPLYFFGSAGLLFGGLGFLGGLNLLYDKYGLGQTIGGRPLLLLTVLLLILGVQFVFFGLLGEMITHNSATATRTYAIKRKI